MTFMQKLKEYGARYTRILTPQDDPTSPIGRSYYNTYQVHTQDLFYLSSLKFKFSGIKKYIYVKLG